MSVISIPQRRHGKKGMWLVATGALVALAVGVGVVVWESRGSAEPRTATVPAPSTSPVLVRGRTAPAPVIYLVGTAAAADTLRGQLADHEEILVALGTAVPYTEVLVVATDEEAHQLRQAISDDEVIRGGLGLPAFQVVDLRALADPGVAASPGVWAERYAEPLAGAGTGSAASVAVASMADMEDATTVVPVAVDTMGGMAELYREQQVANQRRARGTCGEDAQPVTC